MSERIPFVQVDTSGAPAIDAVADGATLVGTEEGLLIAGKDGNDKAQFVKTGTDGAVAVTDNGATLSVDDGGGVLTVDGSVSITGTPSVSVSNFPATQPVSGTVGVSNFPETQPVSAAALPLPTGAATAVKQPALGTAGTPSTDVITVQGATSMTALKVDGSATTQPVSAAALPLPTGAATSTKQDTGNTSLSNIDTKTPALGQAAMAASTPVVLASNQSAVPITDASGSLTVDSPGIPTTLGQKTMANSMGVAFASDQTALPISGTVTATISGVAQDATLTGGTQKAIARGGAKGATTASDVTSTAEGTDHQAIDVQIYHGGAAKDPTQIRTLTSTDTVTIVPSGTQAVSGTVTANLGTIAGVATAVKQPALGSAGTASTDVLTVQGIASMTALKVDGSATTQPVSGTVTANIGTSSLALDATLTGGTQKAIARGGAKGATSAADVTSTASGTDHQVLDVAVYDASGNRLGTSTNPLRVDTTNNTAQAVSGTVTATAIQSTAAALTGRWPVIVTDGTNTMPTADTVARSSFHRVTDGTNTAAVKAASTAPIATDPALVVAVSPNSALPLPTGAATSANQTTLGNQTTKINDGTNTASVKAASTAAVAADPALVVVVSPNTSALPLPTGAATSALQTTGNTSLGNIDTKTAALGQALMAASSPVVIASNQSAVPVSQGAANASLAAGWPVKITDGTNTMPTGDAISRSLYTRLTDGTTLVPVKPANTLSVPTDAALVVAPITPTVAALSPVITSTTSATLLSASSSRRGATIVNDSSAILYIAFQAAASATSYTVALAPAVSGVPSYYEIPQGYAGVVSGVLSTGTGTARVTALS